MFIKINLAEDFSDKMHTKFKSCDGKFENDVKILLKHFGHRQVLLKSVSRALKKTI